MMIMYSRRSRGGSERLRDLGVVRPLLNPEEEDIPLKPGERLEALSQPVPGLMCRQLTLGIRSIRNIPPLDGNDGPSFPAPVLVLEQIPCDGDEPAPERGISPPSAELSKGPEKRLLGQVVDLTIGSTRTIEVPRHRPGVPGNQLGGGALVAGPVGRYELSVALRAGLGWVTHRYLEDARNRLSLSELTGAAKAARFRPERTFGRVMRNRDDRLQRLIELATTIFAEHGFHATSMRDLSRASGMSLAGIYHYVRSKHELLFLIQDQCFAEVTAGAEQALAPLPLTDPEERVRAFICHHVVFFTGHMEKMKVLSHEDDELEGTMREEIRKRKRTYADLLTRLLTAVGHDGVTPQVATYALFGMMNWIYTWYRPAGPIAPARLADELAQLFLNGYLPSTRNAAPLVASHGG